MSKFFTVENVPTNVIERFFAKVMVSPVTGCWIWTASTKNGYGEFGYNGKNVYAHRFTYAWIIEQLPKGKGGLQLDHIICDNRLCCNPWHVKLVSPKENVLRNNNGNCAVNARQKVCVRGHEFSIDTQGRRYCPTCKVIYRRKYYLANNR